MAKKWIEIDFLDLKERQIRRRLQKTREVKQELAEIEPEQTRRKGMVYGLVGVVVFVALTVFVQYKRQLAAAELAAKGQLTVSEVKGDSEFSTPTTTFAPLKQGSKLAASFTVRQGASGRAVLRPFLRESRVAVLDKAEVEFLEIQPDADVKEHPERLTLVVQVKQGTVMAELKQGDPRMEIRLPNKIKVKGLRGFYKVVVDDKGNSVVMVREQRVAVFKGDSKSANQVKADERLIVTNGELGKASSFPTPETVWR